MKEELETKINIDYYLKKISLTTNKKLVKERLNKLIGTPDKIKGDYVEYIRDINSIDIKKILSITILLRGIRRKNK